MLRSVRRFSHPVLHRFAAAGVWSLGGAVLSRGINLLAVLVTARVLVPQSFGQLALLQTVVFFLGGVSEFGLSLAATRLISRERTKRPEVAGRYVALVGALGILTAGLIGGVYVFMAPWVARRLLDAPLLVGTVRVSALVVLFRAALNLSVSSMLGLERFKDVAIARLVESLMSSAFVILGVLAFGVPGAVGGWAAGEGIAVALTLVLVRRAASASAIRISFRPRSQDVREILRYGLPTIGGGLLVEGSILWAQRWLAFQPRGFARVAAFNLSYRWALAILFISSSIAPVVLPILSNLQSEGRGSEFKRILKANVTLVALLTGIPAVVVALLAEPVLSLAGPYYADNPEALIVLMVATLAIAANTVLSQAAVSLDAIVAWVLSDVALALILGGIAFLLIPSLGAAGLAIAYGLGYLLTCLILLIPVRARLRELYLTQQP